MTPTRALRLLHDRGALTLVPELVEAIAGERVRGSWWSHPKGKEIFHVASKLEDSPEIVTAKLIEGKVTFVHERLWPALVRVVTDRKWRQPRIAALDDDARRLLTRVERKKRVEVDDRALTTARRALEKSVLVRSMQQHTDNGRHATFLESWGSWGTKAVASAAAELSLDGALAVLRACRIEL